jgi:hypothetical protein
MLDSFDHDEIPALMQTLHWPQENSTRRAPDYTGHGHMRVNDLVREAIHKKRLLKLSLRGHKLLVEPHAYGLSSQGKPSLLCYRVSDDIATSEGWKVLSLTEIHSVEITLSSFSSPRPGYRRNDTTIAAVFAQL